MAVETRARTTEFKKQRALAMAALQTDVAGQRIAASATGATALHGIVAGPTLLCAINATQHLSLGRR
jgi:hypothetical protein